MPADRQFQHTNLERKLKINYFPFKICMLKLSVIIRVFEKASSKKTCNK